MSNKYDQVAKVFALKISCASAVAHLKDELCNVADEQARAVHALYIASQRGLGYAAPEESTDVHPIDENLIDPEMVDYDALPHEAKDIRLAATDTARKLYVKAHKTANFELEHLLFTVADHVHVEWAREMAANGWSYAPEEDEEEKKTPLLLPFSVILNDPELKENAEYFIEIARALLFNMLKEANCAHPVHQALTGFASVLK